MRENWTMAIPSTIDVNSLAVWGGGLANDCKIQSGLIVPKERIFFTARQYIVNLWVRTLSKGILMWAVTDTKSKKKCFLVAPFMRQ